MNGITLAKEELIGLHVKIKECKDPKWLDKSGIIIDETRNTFILEIDNDRKRIAKNIAKFEFEKNGRKLLLNGSKITYRSEDRTKKVR